MRSALLVMDVQSWIVERMALSSVLEPINEAIEAAREAAIPVIFVGIRFRPGSPDLSTRNMTFGSHRDPQREVDVEIDPRLDARQDDIVVVKKRASAFAGSDLEVVLRSLDVTALVLAGITTGGVVLSTVRQAADADYALTVLADCCDDPDEEIHRVLMTKVFTRQAVVQTTAEWRESIASP